MTRTPIRSFVEALRRYRDGAYAMEVPPVPTYAWSEDDWVFYIFGVRRARVRNNDAGNCDVWVGLAPVLRDASNVMASNVAWSINQGGEGIHEWDEIARSILDRLYPETKA